MVVLNYMVRLFNEQALCSPPFWQPPPWQLNIPDFMLSAVQQYCSRFCLYSFQHWECKSLITFFMYALVCNYMWIFVEGLYLHMLIFVSVFSERSSVKSYICFGWGKIYTSPILSVVFKFNNLLLNSNSTFYGIVLQSVVSRMHKYSIILER